MCAFEAAPSIGGMARNRRNSNLFAKPRVCVTFAPECCINIRSLSMHLEEKNRGGGASVPCRICGKTNCTPVDFPISSPLLLQYTYSMAHSGHIPRASHHPQFVNWVISFQLP
jgi:hypothetical protein